MLLDRTVSLIGRFHRSTTYKVYPSMTAMPDLSPTRELARLGSVILACGNVSGGYVVMLTFEQFPCTSGPKYMTLISSTCMRQSSQQVEL